MKKTSTADELMKWPHHSNLRNVRPPSEGWSRHPNLRFRPHAPNKGRGRLQIQVRRCFLGYRFRITSQVFDYALARVRGDVWRRRHRWSVIRVLDQVAERVGRDRAHGAIIWKLKEPLE